MHSDLGTSHTEHAHHLLIIACVMDRLCGDMLTQWVEVGCVDCTISIVHLHNCMYATSSAPHHITFHTHLQRSHKMGHTDNTGMQSLGTIIGMKDQV